jgi:hypothetical protein
LLDIYTLEVLGENYTMEVLGENYTMEVLLEFYTLEVFDENYPNGGLVRDLHPEGLERNLEILCENYGENNKSLGENTDPR